MKKTSILAFCAFVVGIGNMPSVADIMDASALLDFPNPPADHVVSYGQDELQFGELRLPAGDGPHPVMVLIHGGCWLSEFDIAHIRKLAAAFTAEGIATWTIEYRRVGDPGGGWRGTFDDAAAGTDFLATLAEKFDLDLQRVVFAGHSAGGHLAIWLANRPSQWPAVVTPVAVLGLAPAADLAYAHKQGYCDNVVDKLMADPHPKYQSVINWVQALQDCRCPSRNTWFLDISTTPGLLWPGAISILQKVRAIGQTL